MKKRELKTYICPVSTVETVIVEGLILAGTTINVEGGAGGGGAGETPGHDSFGKATLNVDLSSLWGQEEDEEETGELWND